MAYVQIRICPEKYDLKFSDIVRYKRVPTRKPELQTLNGNKCVNLRTSLFQLSNRIWKLDTYMDLVIELKKLRNMKLAVISIIL